MPDASAPPIPSSLLGDLSPDTFLSEYWQKKPLLVRDALPEFRSPLEPEELAGLALEPNIESRIILEHQARENGSPDGEPWELREGPFDQDAFLDLPETHWTLLVQEVDRLVPEVGDLLEHFRFLPDWRIDDVMISYAPEGGNVGPHIDNYDVFLLQGLGHRDWQYGTAPVENESIVEGLDLRILDTFEPDEQHVLGPGDMLYLPPRVAHHGVATDDCMTYSIGFRAPSHRELVGDFLQYAIEHIDPNARYSDPEREPASAPGEISDEDLARIRSVLRDVVADDAAIDRWFGRFITEPQRNRMAVPREEPLSAQEVTDQIRTGTDLRRTPAARIAFTRRGDGAATLFANGEARPLDAPLLPAAEAVAGRERVPADDLTPHLNTDGVGDLLADLVNEGLLEFDAS
jgi:50S ribosomal protein L16 3-hydroxylase